MKISDLIPQKIGIFYKSKEWAEKILEDYYNSIPYEMVKMYSRKFHYIVLKDGTVIQAVPADDTARGYKWSKVIVQDGVSEEFFNLAIRPSVVIEKFFVGNDDGEFEYKFLGR